ncbi:MAG: histidine kinase dimerization/phospho-acceptor domain-containing protein [Dehalococcoidia bacterium]
MSQSAYAHTSQQARASRDDVAGRNERNAGEDLAEAIETIESSAARMSAMIGDLLDLARIQTGQPPELHRRQADLVAIARRLIVAAHSDQSVVQHGGSLTAESKEGAGSVFTLRLPMT